jgi:hypothetical protein
MAVNIPTSKPKTIFYKMVTAPKVKVTAQNSATVTSYKAFTQGVNRLGATLNSMLVVTKKNNDALLESLKMKVRSAEDEKKQLDKEKHNKKGGGLTKLASNVLTPTLAVVGNFFEGLMGLFGTVMRVMFGQALLRWIANPANMEKLTAIWKGLVSFFTFLWKFVSGSIANTLSGLAKMLDSNKSFWERLQGFGQFLIGFGGLMLGLAFLKNPKILFSGIKFVLKTIWDSVTGLIKMLAGRKRGMSKGVPPSPGAAGKPGATGSVPGDTPAGKGKGRGKFGKIMEGIGAVSMIAAPLVIGGMMGSGESAPTGAPAPGGDGGSPAPAPAAGGGAKQTYEGMPQLATGGIATKPTQALIGERGPEARIKLQGGAVNARNMAAAGIKPLNGMGQDPSKAKNLADLMVAPFKGIGAGIIANIGEVMGSIPGGDKATSALGSIIAPIANSFGVPASLVKKLSGKTASKGKEKEQKSKLPGLFGKGKIVNVSGDKFQSKGDTSVLGLLTNLVGVGQVLINKVGKGSGQVGTGKVTESGTGGTKSDGTGGGKSDMQVGDSVARGLSGKAGEGTEKDEAKVGRSSKGVLDFIKSKGSGHFSGKTIRLSSGILNSPGDLKSVEDQLKFLKDAGAKVQLVGVPTNNPTYSPLNEKLKTLATKYGAQWMGGFEAGTDKIHPKDYATLNAKMDTEVKSATQSVDQSIDKNFGMKTGQETKFKASDGNEYIAHKTKEGFKFFRTGAAGVIDQTGQLLANALGQNKDGDNKSAVDTKDGKNSFILADWQRSEGGKKPVPLTKTNPPPQKANGGWISGPQSGYPVSLDGGGSTSFIGHGTEWVGMKRAAGGSAFVVPFDTPATKNNAGLTSSRMTQAKSGGYALPTFAKGGTTNAPNWKGDTGPNSRWNLVANEKSKEIVGKRLKTKFADGGKIAAAAKSMVGQYFGQDGCAKSTRAMLAKAGVAPNPLVTKKILDPGTNGSLPTGPLRANSFGSDQGTVIKSAGKVEAGDVVLWDTGGGEIGHVGIAIGDGQTVHNSSGAGYKLAKMGITGMKFHSAVRLGGTTAAPGDPASGTDPASGAAPAGGAPPATSADPSAGLAVAFDKLNSMLYGTPMPSAPAGAAAATTPGAPATKPAPGPTPSATTSPVAGASVQTAAAQEKLKSVTAANNKAQVASALGATATAANRAKATVSSVTPTPPPPLVLPSQTTMLDISQLAPQTGMIVYAGGR